LDPNIEKGGDVIVKSCLCVAAGDVLHLLTWGAEDVAEVVARAAERAGAKLERIRLETLVEEAGSPRIDLQLAARLAGAKASILIAGGGLPGPLGYAVVRAAAQVRSRHIHMPRVDVRMLSQGVRASPDVLATINDRVLAVIKAPSRVTVSSPSGTELEISLAAQFAIVSAIGRPLPGEADNLPSGSVYTHPGGVEGTFVADRATLSSEIHERKKPVTFTMSGGNIERVEASDKELVKRIEDHLASHPRAKQVGLVTFPTNYLVRSEIGVPVQDALLPGISLSLGFSASKFTRAPHDAPVQMLLLGRKHTVIAGGKAIVTDGRFEQHIVEGLDPFR
jgi:leucyl aminopeptidase (aminopeptidase T)